MQALVKQAGGLSKGIRFSVPDEVLSPEGPFGCRIVKEYESLQIIDEASGSKIGSLKFTQPASITFEDGRQIKAQ